MPSPPRARPPRKAPSDDTAIVLTGGGARAAYQVGLLRCLGRRMPGLRIPIVTGVSAGAINAAFLAAHPGTMAEAAHDLSAVWRRIHFGKVFRVDTPWLARNAWRWILRLGTGGGRLAPHVEGLMDTAPLRRLLESTLETDGEELVGIARNLDRGTLRAAALITLNYSTGQTVVWIQGRDIDSWERPLRRSRQARLTIDHVMASAALPLLFPAVRLGGSWFGDGGIRLAAPLSPALHLGARRVLAISTRYGRSHEEADRPYQHGYPPPAQIVGNLLNAVFLDVLDQDVVRLERLNQLVRRLPPEEREGLHPIDVLLLRPSQDLGRLSAEFEPDLPKAFRYLTRSLGTRETSSPDFLSLLMFAPGYLERLIEIGEADAEARMDEIATLLGGASGETSAPHEAHRS